MELELGGPGVTSGPRDDEATVVSAGDDGTNADDDVAAADFALDASVLDTIEQELADVERALALLDEGTYGRCEHCGGAIDDDVLARTPTARYCAEHLPLALG